MKIRLLIKGDAIQFGEDDFFCPCKTIDVDVADGLIDKEHEHIIGVEIQPKMEVCIYQKTRQDEDAISRKSIKKKLQEHHDFFIYAYGGFNNLPQNEKSRVDEITNCISMVVNEPSISDEDDKTDVLDKIIAEIEQLSTKTRTNWDGCCPDIDCPEIEYVDVTKKKLVDIINKYK